MGVISKIDVGGTTYNINESKSASSGGTATSLVTTGEKYIWNNKQDALTFETPPSSSNKVATMAELTAANGHTYVDLGLPSGTLWATMNVGATSETGYGNYYLYGKGSAQYAETYGQSDYTGTENPLNFSVDTARQVWGGSWHMPTLAQLNELRNNTTYTWETNFNGSGINGGKYTAQNGNYVFFPAAGYYGYNTLRKEGSQGYLWSSRSYDSTLARYLTFNSTGFENINYDYRMRGFSVRAVIDSIEKYATKAELPTTMGASGSSHAGGLVPDTPSTVGTTKYLCENGQWTAPVTYGTSAGTVCEGNDSRLSNARVASNQIASYTTISANMSGVTTSLTIDGAESKIYYNSGSSTVTVSFATSGLTFVDGNDSMEIAGGGFGEVNFLRVTTNSTTEIFVRSTVSE